FCDLGPRFGDASDRGPDGNPDRYPEIWNLVFMQNECDAAIEPVAELPKKNIDTGAGLERLALVLQGARSIYETDTLGGLVERAEALTGQTYGSNDRVDMGLRILADHGRFLTFLIADGVLPSNEARGYVLRRVMRRAIRQGRSIGRTARVLPELIEGTIELMGDFYPELAERKDFILDVADREEARFGETLRQGLTLLEGELEKARGSESGVVTGDVAFRLHDTFGFPIDLTREIAEEQGVEVEVEGFAALMEGQRERARAARRSARAGGDAADGLGASLLAMRGPVEFVGYEHLRSESNVVALFDGPESLTAAGEGSEVDIVLDPTPFYAEGGGQVGDRGTITTPGGAGEVINTRRLLPGLSASRIRVTAGEIGVGDIAQGLVDGAWRTGCERAHTATHILHWVLRDKLGEHATQAGSLVEPGRLRFDFSHHEAVGGRVDEIAEEIQSLVLVDDPVRTYETSFDFAKSIGAMAIFGEKYGDFVRVVEVGAYSKELCGGTHVPHTSQIGVVVVTAEGSVGANLRRIEALVGRDGISYLARRAAVLEDVASTLKTNPEEVAERVERLLSTQKEMERRLAEVERRAAEADAAALADTAVDVGGTRLVAARRDVGVDALRSLAQSLRGKLESAVIVLGTASDGRANLVGAITKDLTERGISARDVLAPGAALLGGGAGGKPDLAVSGGPAAEKIDEAIEAAAAAARASLER
ncbi:MAG: alanine--tRNA ligase, partial [Actinomycetota bacterium]|nr:alanine--tRNA ligase [Actinomycetota bacterium]